MVSHQQIIKNCKNQVLKNEKITESDAKKLFKIEDKFLKDLSFEGENLIFF